MNLGLLGVIPIIGPTHGQNGIDQGTIDTDEIAQLGISFGNLLGRLYIKLPKEFHHLLQSS